MSFDRSGMVRYIAACRQNIETFQDAIRKEKRKIKDAEKIIATLDQKESVEKLSEKLRIDASKQ